MSILRRTKIPSLALLLCGVLTALGQVGGFDSSFVTGSILNDGLNAKVTAAIVQSNGFIIVAGDFTSIGGIQRNRIARLTNTGALDPAFSPQGGANGPIFAMVLQPDGKILIGGEFTTYNGVVRNRIARINSDGSLDATFDPGVGANDTVRAIAVNGDSYYYGYGYSILIGGNFTSFGGETRNRIAQLGSNGTLDMTFDPGSGANDTVYAIAVNGTYNPTGIYVGGAFTNFGGQTRNRLAKISSNGGLDYSFNGGNGLDGDVYVLALIGNAFSSSAGLYVGGNFTSVDGIVRGRIARFSVSWYSFGSALDQNFNVWTDGPVRAIVPESQSFYNENKLLMAGDFNIVNGVSKNRLARLLINSDSFYSFSPFGSSVFANVDINFNPSPGINNTVFSVGVLPDGRSLVGGAFNQVSGVSCTGLARLYGDIGSSLPDAPTSFSAWSASSTQIILQWNSVNYASSIKIERSLNGINGWSQVGSSSSQFVDSGLSPGTTYFYRIKASNYNGDGPYSIIQSAATETSPWTGPGALDPSTGTNSGPNSSVNAIAKQIDGKIVVVGSFSQVGGLARKYVARLNTNWSVDTSFDPGTGPNSSINAVAIQLDGKILIGGHFSKVSGVDRKYIARLNSNGTLDTTFDSGIGPSSSVESISVQADGKILVGGWFSQYNGYSQNYIARLNADGSLDMGYRTTPNSIVYDIEVQPDGRAIIGGSFSRVNGVSKSGVARINVDGTIDDGFNPGSGANSVEDIFIQSDGKILIAGGFSTFNGTARKHVARIEFDGVLDTSFDPGIGPSSSVKCVAVDAEGKVVIGGHFTSVSGLHRPRVARLNSDGVLDITFRPGVGMNGVINDLLVLDATKIVVGGGFTTVGGNSVNYIARLIGGVNGQLLITSVNPLPNGTAGSNYSHTFTASGGTPPYSWSVISGSLPPGLEMNYNGTISGNPTTTINTSFLLRVTDANFQNTDRIFNLNTFDIPSGLVILDATYGANGTTVNVKSFIEQRIANNSVNMTVSNGNLGGDPVFGKVKTLYVRYQDSTGHYDTTVQEGSTLILPSVSHRRLPMAYLQWATTKFSSGQIGNILISGHEADPDGDGISNLLESAFGGNPLDSQSNEVLPFYIIRGDKIEVTFICDSNRSDLIYSVEASEDLNSWSEIARSIGGSITQPVSNLSVISDSGNGLRYVKVTDNVEISKKTKRFLRVKVRIP